MKNNFIRVGIIIAGMTLLLSIALVAVSCKNNKSSTEQLSPTQSEIVDIEKILGNTANDYLNTDISKNEADEKIEVLRARTKDIAVDELSEEWSHRHSNLLSAFVQFEYDLWKGNIDNIKEIKNKYFK